MEDLIGQLSNLLEAQKECGQCYCECDENTQNIVCTPA